MILFVLGSLAAWTTIIMALLFLAAHAQWLMLGLALVGMIWMGLWGWV